MPASSLSIDPALSARPLLRPVLALLVGLTLVALALMAWIGPRPADMMSGAGFETPPPSPPPAVEPAEIKAVAPETARAINAAVPFINGRVPAARPFHAEGSTLDRERATDCLASALYYEAGAEAESGQRAVAQVVLNRVRHPAFPATVCGVVYQGATRRTGCQFSFSCDGSMARRPSAALWLRLRGLAGEALAGAVYAPVGLATHYHTDWVVPAWSAKLDKLRAERTHLFFRWAGWWGTPPAFRQAYRGSEPRVGRLAGLSSAHATALPGETAMDTGSAPLPETVAGGTEPVPEGQVPAFASPAGNFLIFTISPRVNAGLLPDMAKAACGTQPYCKVMMWTDPVATPTALPVSEEALSSMAFSYLRNEKGAFEKALWNCTLFQREDASQCMKARVPVAVAPRDAPREGSRPAGMGSPAAGLVSPEDARDLIPVERDDGPDAGSQRSPVPRSEPGGTLIRRRPGG